MTILGGMGTFWGPARRRAGADPAEPADHVLHRVLAVGARHASWSSCSSSSRAASSGAGSACRRCAPAEARAMLEVRDAPQELRRLRRRRRREPRPSTRGQIAAIIGPNGAGKTTLFNLITGHLRPDTGQVLLDGRDITGIAPHDICRMGMGRSFQRTNIFPQADRVRERAGRLHRPTAGAAANLWSRVGASLPRRDRGAARPRSGLARPGRATVSGLPVARRPEAARAGHRAGQRAADPAARRADRRHVGDRDARDDRACSSGSPRERGLTLLFTEHDMEVVFSIAQQITVLHQGRVIADGHARRGARAIPRCAASTSGRAGDDAPLLEVERHPHRLRPVAGAVRRLARGRARRVRVPARPQRRRQDHHHALDHGPDAADARAASCGRGATSPAGRPTGWRAPASASCPRTAASSPS